jgi:ABC-type dipeptide/oligopeptide/nickel transport system permease subunit
MIGLVILGIIVLAAIFAPWVAPHDPTHIHYEAMLAPPDRLFLLGTDEIGRDNLSRLIWGARVSLEIVAVSIIAASTGSAIGLVSGYFGGWLDDIVMRVMTGSWPFRSWSWRSASSPSWVRASSTP